MNQRKAIPGIVTNLPATWRSELQALTPEESKRIESLVSMGQTAPLPIEKETGPFFLFVLGDSIEEVANKSGTPKDVIYLTAISHRWQERKAELMRNGSEQMIAELQKALVNQILVATQISVMRQVGDIMSGRGDPDKVLNDSALIVRT